MECPYPMGRVLGTAKSVRGPRLVLGSGRAGLTTQHEQALMEQPGEREQPGREPDPRPGVAELTRCFAVERVTRIELAWPAWKESARPREPTRMRPWV
jgi:hypothetical protein